MKLKFAPLCAFVLALFWPMTAWAYIGPGAGFAFLGSTFVFFLAIAMGIVTLLFWPFFWIVRKLRGKGISRKARTRRIVILGLDGLEPSLLEKYMEEGKLPKLKELREQGCYSKLGTTIPALSPVAWSTFQTGVNPGAHNIFDFLSRDKRTCLPELSSTKTETLLKRIGLGKFSVQRPSAKISLLRKSQPFWKILGRHGIFSNIIRVPISYPPEKFDGNVLSAMCTPDLRGTQGTFSFFTTKSKNAEAAKGDGTTGGEITALEKAGEGIYKGKLLGPADPRDKKGAPLAIEFTLQPDGEDEALLTIGDTVQRLELGEFSQWIPVEFVFGRKKIAGICRFCLRELTPDVSLYVTPINANPEEPALPIAEPIFFSTWLAKRRGLFGTLGLMEDTWGRNEFALDDERFLQQALLTHAEREGMLFEVLKKTPEGLCACVFDASDRIQHMFWRYLDDKHPSPREANEKFVNAIPDMYRMMDDMVGRVREQLNENDVLLILSDHGFSSFRRCINLNTWLEQEGYLVVKDKKAAEQGYLRGVDWTKTKAFALGLTGIFLNRKGRETHGILDEAEAKKVQEEIVRKLEKLCDPADGTQAVRKVYESDKVYRGVYAREAPDLIVGCSPGYRVSWECVTGGFEPQIFCDNLKAWSGDHHIDPEVIPGIFLSNRKAKVANPHIIDLAPTVLDLFSVPVPRYMEGRVII